MTKKENIETSAETRTYRELFIILNGIKSFSKEKCQPFFALGLNRNKKKIEAVVEPLQETFAQLTDEEKETYKELGKAEQVVAEKKFKTKALLEEALEEVHNSSKKFKDLKARIKEIDKINNDLIDQEVEIDFYKINTNLLPEMTFEQMEAIADLLQDTVD